MDALLCFGVCLAIYTALVSGITCLAVWSAPQSFAVAVRLSAVATPWAYSYLPKRKVFHHRHCHHLEKRDATAFAFQPCDNCVSLW